MGLSFFLDLLCKQDVIGSNPFSSTKETSDIPGFFARWWLSSKCDDMSALSRGHGAFQGARRHN